MLLAGADGAGTVGLDTVVYTFKKTRTILKEGVNLRCDIACEGRSPDLIAVIDGRLI